MEKYIGIAIVIAIIIIGIIIIKIREKHEANL